MKKSKILALALCLTCLPVHGAATGAAVGGAGIESVDLAAVDIAPHFRVFNDTDAGLGTVNKLNKKG